jgi:hypothetical protein
MGYTTDFEGEFMLDRPLNAEHQDYLQMFSETRRMKRDSNKAIVLLDPIRDKANLPIGVEGEYFVGGPGFKGQNHDNSVVDSNSPPFTQPGLWCQWVPSYDGSSIVWDEGEKFYRYVEWLEYIIENFLKRWGYTINGEVTYQGEDSSDFGMIIVKDNVVTQKVGRKVYN